MLIVGYISCYNPLTVSVEIVSWADLDTTLLRGTVAKVTQAEWLTLSVQRCRKNETMASRPASDPLDRPSRDLLSPQRVLVDWTYQERYIEKLPALIVQGRVQDEAWLCTDTAVTRYILYWCIII